MMSCTVHTAHLLFACIKMTEVTELALSDNLDYRASMAVSEVHNRG